MNYEQFFRSATGYHPFPYQKRLGEESWPELVEVPTGLGKTAAVVVAWLWKILNADEHTPLRLAYCLPMRVLVEQTRGCIERWISSVSLDFNEKGRLVPRVNLLMGGETQVDWIESPEEPFIVIGTQDMLLSRALMRGYGMSRFQWPIHFALLHNDTLWIYDEVQLMGAGLPTSAQLEAFRRRFPLARPSQSLWISATLNPKWLGTVDLMPHLEKFECRCLDEGETVSDAVRKRREAVKRLQKAETSLTAENRKQLAKDYAEALASEVADRHVSGMTTLIVVNTVERCQALMKALERQGNPGVETFAVHSRYRPEDRCRLNGKLTEVPALGGPGRIIVATQAVEAGVDMTSQVLFTELAPWSSLVQRFGRCNRYGEAGPLGADVLWIDIEQSGKLATPYDEHAIDQARNRLVGLASASSVDLPCVDEEAPITPVIRNKDLRELFNTDPDLTGFDVDISPYIRDAEDLDVHLFWRDLSDGYVGQLLPHEDELCRASITQVRDFIARIRKGKQELRAYSWDSLDGKWRVLQGDPRPGLVLMLDRTAGGYTEELGFDPMSKEPVVVVVRKTQKGETEAYDGDERSWTVKEVTLADHLLDAATVADQLADAVKLFAEHHVAVVTAASWHDVGKAHAVFQATMHGCSIDEAENRTPLLAKSASAGRHRRKHFRHELASMLAWLAYRNGHEQADLIAYLITAHHGKVRLSLRSVPGESEPTSPFGPRFARGVWERETLPEIVLADGDTIPSTRLSLDLMELGDGPMGPSWTARTQRLLDRYGPFQLAWLEALVRIADWRASAAEQEVRL